MKERRENLVYDLAAANVRRYEPRANDVRASKPADSFPQTLKRALIAQHSREIPEADAAKHAELMEWAWTNNWRPAFIPDLWFVDPDEQLVHLFEVEDTSPLTADKLARLVDFFWCMDNESWAVRLVVFDRYGLNPREINLQRAAATQMGIDTNSAGYRAANAFLRLPPDDDTNRA